jgi:hypothetical protein
LTGVAAGSAGAAAVGSRAADAVAAVGGARNAGAG